MLSAVCVGRESVHTTPSASVDFVSRPDSSYSKSVSPEPSCSQPSSRPKAPGCSWSDVPSGRARNLSCPIIERHGRRDVPGAQQLARFAGADVARTGIDVEALKNRFYPVQTIDTGKETLEWLQKRMPPGIGS